MKNLGSILSVGLAVMAIIGIGIAFKKSPQVKTSPTAVIQDTTYFSQISNVMYFYREDCAWCQKEKEVLEELGTLGYKVKPMDVRADPDSAIKYKVEGTPTFVAANGDRLTGYQTKEQLKLWLDQHK